MAEPKAQGDLTRKDAIARRAKFFRGLGDASRLAILDALAEGECSVQEIVMRTGLGQPNVSNHLRCLLECGLVSRRSEGRFARYRLSDARVAGLIGDVDRLLAATATGVEDCEHYVG
jgi:DNA-binding transcriptional ArsR family regulator